ncbi:MAG TPA: hypothetical protein PKE29_09790 [Phycisphaerales bacterium]|nr:hypothetical protein [Phycisphaerales bacterium]
MSYDTDHRRRILGEVRTACVAGRFSHAVGLMQQGAANLSAGNRRIPVRLLRTALGEACADRLVKWCVVRPCVYCNGGREECAECRGTGEEKGGSVCQDCGGFGSRRCPFCNGTAFAGYDFVPEGLRTVVMSGRVRLALARIAAIGKRSPARASGTDKPMRVVIELDRCRGVLANACERVRLGDATTPGAAEFSHATAVRIEKACRAANAKAEAIIGRYLVAIGGRAGGSMSVARAAYLAGVAARPHLAPSAVETPRVFRRP